MCIRDSYYKIAKQDLSYREKLRGYADIARKRLAAAKFEAFCDKHLAPLEEAAFAWFRSARCEEAIRLKVANLFPEHEVEEFTGRFWDLVKQSVDDMCSATA